VIDYETFCRIHDCHHRQGLTIAQTARSLGLHRSTVAIWLARARFARRRSQPRPSKLDLLAGDDEDLRRRPLSMRKVALAQLLADTVEGIFVAEFEQGDIGDVLFKVACKWASRALSRSTSIALTAPADANIGSR
jgi:transcriptional regulator with XRE-family HTH domain